jgi:hypothetical protein
MEKYSSYKNGINIGDFIKYKATINSFFQYTGKGLIIDRKFLFCKDTKWGERSFFEYSLFDNNIVEKIKTQNIKIISINKL